MFNFDSPVICLKYFSEHRIIFVGTYKEIIFINESFELIDRMTVGSPVRTAVCRKDGTIYIGLSSMTQNPMLMLDASGVLREIEYEDRRLMKRGFMVMDMCLDNDENLWIATAGNSLLKYDGLALTDFNSNNSDVNDNVVLSVRPDTTGQGNIWFGTESKGFGILGMPDWNEKRGRYTLGPDMMQMMLPEYEFKRYWTTQHLNIGGVYTCGQVWDASDYEERYEEILQANDQYEEVLDNYRGYDNSEDDGEYKGEQIALFSGQVKSIALDNKQRVWLGTIKSGIIRFQWNTESVIYHSANFNLPDNDVYTIITDDENRAWAGTDRGLIVIDEKVIKVYDTDNSPIQCNEIRSILLLDNFVLLGYNAKSSNPFGYSGSNNCSLDVIPLADLDDTGEVVSSE